MYTKDISILLYIYLHTDRLGSGSAVTDGRGEAVHELGYMPYGETLLDLSHTHYETPYQFTGYEKDKRQACTTPEPATTTHGSVPSTPPTRCGTSIQVYRRTPTVRIIP